MAEPRATIAVTLLDPATLAIEATMGSEGNEKLLGAALVEVEEEDEPDGD